MHARRYSLPRLLAGLQVGMLGGLAILAWLLGLSLVYLDSPWALFNLFAFPILRHSVWTDALSWRTIIGIALHLFSSGVLGMLVGWLVPRPEPGDRISVAAMVFGVLLSLLAYEMLWRRLLPQLSTILPPLPVFLAHGLFGACLSWFPSFFLALDEEEPPPPPAEPLLLEPPSGDE
jgi:hypothetical protein